MTGFFLRALTGFKIEVEKIREFGRHKRSLALS